MCRTDTPEIFCCLRGWLSRATAQAMNDLKNRAAAAQHKAEVEKEAAAELGKKIEERQSNAPPKQAREAGCSER